MNHLKIFRRVEFKKQIVSVKNSLKSVDPRNVNNTSPREDSALVVLLVVLVVVGILIIIVVNFVG